MFAEIKQKAVYPQKIINLWLFQTPYRKDDADGQASNMTYKPSIKTKKGYMKNDRTGRIMQLLAMLQHQRGYKISELAGMLGKSYRDLKELERAGLPCRFDTRQHYHLAYSENAWYAIGESSFHRAVHALELNNITQLSPLDRYFVEDEKFDLREYFGYARSLLRECQIYEVELRFCPGIASDIAEVQWHETQTTSFDDDGSAVLKFRVDGLNEITWWILGYGDQVEVLAPKSLRQRLAQIASRILDSQRG